MNNLIEKKLLALDIIYGQQVDMFLLKHSDMVETYNDMARVRLTVGQFKLLKELESII